MLDELKVVIVLGGSPGGVEGYAYLDRPVAKKITTIVLCGVEEDRLFEQLEDYEDDEPKPVYINEYTDNDPEGWLWDGDSVGGTEDDSEFARKVFAQQEQPCADSTD